MKKIILFCLSIFGLISQAQILNPSFETVTANKPDDWNTAANNYATYYIKDTSDAKTGNHAAYIKGFSDTTYAVQGAVLGTFTMNARPLTLTGWYKCNIVPGDSLIFYTNVYQSTAFTGAVANGYTYTQSSSVAYKQFTNTINYSNFPAGSGGSAYIGIYFSGINVDNQGVAIPQTGTWAIIDDLAFTFSTTPTNTNTVGMYENSSNVNIEQLYPQPSTNVSFLIYTLNESAQIDLNVFDVTGKLVKTVFTNEKQTPGRYKAEIDLSNLEPGIYFSRLVVGSEVKTSKIIKQ